jgi:chromosome partitioning protein
VTAPNTKGPFIVAVASPKGGCGKSTIALNLSLSLARRGNSVMLVDSDVNGDVLSALDARDKVKIGALDVIHERLHLRDAVMNTVLSQFKLVPAVGKELPPLDVLDADHTERWRELLTEASKQADIVVVDTPAGMLGTTRQVLASCTHVIGVLQAEAIAERSFQRFTQALERLPGPQLLGVVLNMLQTRHGVSLNVLQNTCSSEIGPWLFDTTIPRHPAFLDAAATGSPLRRLDDNAPPAVAFLFDNLASEVAERLGLVTTKDSAQSLLL